MACIECKLDMGVLVRCLGVFPTPFHIRIQIKFIHIKKLQQNFFIRYYSKLVPGQEKKFTSARISRMRYDLRPFITNI